MRQGQQNRRGRGRNNNNNRKGGGGHHHNPLSRSFESNGPDVKIRGTPAHIAEKYIALARDAQSSGDPVLAENYLQHAEHYGRIIMAYREQLNPQGEGMNGGSHRMRMPGEIGDDEFGDDEGNDAGEEGLQQVHTPQPPRSEGNRDGRQEGRHDGNNRDGNNRQDRPFRRDQGRNRERFSNDRNNDRGDRSNDRNDRGERPHQAEASRPPPLPERQQDQAADSGNDPRRRERNAFQQPHEQPEFLRRPVRRARPEAEDAEKDETSRD